ncbi:MAG: DNA mismatch repair protein MutS [Alphaproteobacteria bacterium]|nr:DNA mismatch repair protein MutS [Alphaproteobacteria bacterium]
MMAQYHATKLQYPDCLLFYRMGDFYELFYEDAEKASRVLDITLTRRGKSQGDDIAMCGVPFHACEPYVAKLIKAGFKVAICEQMETPEEAKKRGGDKALVRRDVVRVITAGTLTEDNLLDAKANNFLSAISLIKNEWGLAWLDLSTGAFFTRACKTLEDLLPALAALDAKEILLSDNLPKQEALETRFEGVFTRQSPLYFDTATAEKNLCTFYDTKNFSSFGDFTPAEISAAGALLRYAAHTQKEKLPRLAAPSQQHNNDFMLIDPATRRNLELHKTITGEKAGSLLSVIDRTLTAGGGRLLASALAQPLCSIRAVNNRLKTVSLFFENNKLAETLRETLRTSPDMERALARLSVGRGSPRDLAALKDGMRRAETLQGTLLLEQNKEFASIAAGLALPPALQAFADKLTRALSENLPFLARDGGFIKQGYAKNLDELRLMRDDSQRLIAQLQGQYIKKTGIDSLKITYNNVLGYFIEVPAKRADVMMNNTDFIHRQTMANAVRFTTPDLATLERDISSAAEKSLGIELALFDEFVQETMELAASLSQTAEALNQLDMFTSLAILAREENYVCPEICDEPLIDIQGGRHPVVEHALRQKAAGFIPNNCKIDNAERIWLLTGPNMAGKSTFLRQNALIIILAQMGSFVPAKAARIGLVDRLFSRVGASDDLARGHSTFMVEMVETAAILNQSTARSFVILDEIGRGTATFDGLSIAWAALEYLHEKLQCRTLFATHYHELNQLKETLPALTSYSMAVKEWNGDIVFLHEVKAGAADRSYGIHVAELAGLPASVTARAQDVLTALEKKNEGSSENTTATLQSPPDFNKPQINDNTALIEKLNSISPDALSPREALELIYALKSLV